MYVMFHKMGSVALAAVFRWRGSQKRLLARKCLVNAQ